MLSHPSLTFTRSLSTSSRTLSGPTIPAIPRSSHRDIAPYPYGSATTYKQSNKGLYGSSKIQFGNIVSERNEVKTRRVWRPNVHRKRLWSEALGGWVRVRVQARVQRTIDKVGGLDEYLLSNKTARIKDLGMAGWRLRWKLMGTDKVRERFARERERLGIVGIGVGADLVGRESVGSGSGSGSTMRMVNDEEEGEDEDEDEDKEDDDDEEDEDEDEDEEEEEEEKEKDEEEEEEEEEAKPRGIKFLGGLRSEKQHPVKP